MTHPSKVKGNGFERELVQFFDPGIHITLVIPAVPVAQPRPRASSFGGRVRVHEVVSIKSADGSRKPHPIAAFKATCRMAAQQAYSKEPLDGPLSVRLVFVMPRPTAMQWKTRPMPRLPHAKKPDVDNLAKSVFDALTGLLWLDDAQIAACSIEKWIAAGDEQPHVVVEVSK